MKNTVQQDLLQAVAKKHGVDREEVRLGIREAVNAARIAENGEVHAFWKTLPEDATECEIVLQIVKQLVFAE